MSEVIRDSAIKLFGQIIYLPQCPYTSFATSTSQDSKAESRDGSISPREEKSTETTSSSDITEDPNSPKKDDQSSDASQEKTTLKKPDKIIPCPRCNSMETKFCYYNNYNVNQPRHFCKNCQRYWTSGGTMRSMPVGSGRRKNKTALLRTYPHIMVQDAIQTNGLLISPLGFPANFYPAALYWGSAAPCVNTASPASSAHSSSVLGKHSRGGEVIRPSNLLRIHDRSCIKKEVFKGDGDSSIDDRAMVMQANPAAMSRSLNFHL